MWSVYANIAQICYDVPGSICTSTTEECFTANAAAGPGAYSLLPEVQLRHYTAGGPSCTAGPDGRTAAPERVDLFMVIFFDDDLGV